VKAFGVTPDEMVELTEAVAEILDDQVLTREDLVAELGTRLDRPDLEAELRPGWGAVFKPVAWQGVLCHGPASGNGDGGPTAGALDAAIERMRDVVSALDSG
jgi:hypothetical protein